MGISDEQRKKDFFISYNKHDEKWAEWIAWQLENADYKVVIQLWDWAPEGFLRAVRYG